MADSFTALSFAGAVGKLAINVSNASLGRILDCYGEAGGKNVALGTSAQDNSDTDAFIKRHHEDTDEVTTSWSDGDVVSAEFWVVSLLANDLTCMGVQCACEIFVHARL